MDVIARRLVRRKRLIARRVSTSNSSAGMSGAGIE
jgi:hypothetical protein